MKLARKIVAASLFAVTPFWLAGSVHAVPIGMGLGLTDAVAPAAETVRYGGGGGRVGGGGGRIGGVGRVGGVGGVGRVGGVGGVGGIGGVGRPGYGWNGGYGRPGYGLAAGALVGGAIAAGSYYGGYGYDNGYYDPGYYGSSYYGSGYGYDPGYSTYSTSGGQDAAYCAQRFKSYDPASGTYLGYDGIRHPCP
jgi:hypothetical protein